MIEEIAILSRPGRGYVFKCRRTIMPACKNNAILTVAGAVAIWWVAVGRPPSPRPNIRNCRLRGTVSFSSLDASPRQAAGEKRVTEAGNFPNISLDRRAEQIFIEFATVLEQLETFFPLFSTFAPLEISFFPPPSFLRRDFLARKFFSIPLEPRGILGRSHNR